MGSGMEPSDVNIAFATLQNPHQTYRSIQLLLELYCCVNVFIIK